MEGRVSAHAESDAGYGSADSPFGTSAAISGSWGGCCGCAVGLLRRKRLGRAPINAAWDSIARITCSTSEAGGDACVLVDHSGDSGDRRSVERDAKCMFARDGPERIVFAQAYAELTIRRRELAFNAVS